VVTLNGNNMCAGAQKRPCEATGPRAYLIHMFTGQRARDGRDTIKQLLIKKEVLAKRLAGG
jgi:hypothetical protein